MNLRPSFYLFISLIFLSGCSVGPRYSPPIAEVPSEWKNRRQDISQKENSDSPKGDQGCYLDYWWQVFHDPKLDELEAFALENNRDLLVAFERVQTARALKGIAEANFYPKLTLTPFTSNEMYLDKNYINQNALGSKKKDILSTGTVPFRTHEVLYYLPINLSYEVDLWGKIRDRYQAAKYEWEAQEKEYEAAMLSLTTNVAIAYYQIRAADMQLDLLRQTLQTREKTLAINEARFEEQIAFFGDVTIAAREVEKVRFGIEEVLRQRKTLEDFIAVLLGVAASEFEIEHLPLSAIPPSIPEGIPSEVLLRRPDIAEAELQTRSKHALVKSAYAEFFPSLTFSTAGGFQSPLLRDMLSTMSRYWLDTVEFNQVLFDGGATYNNYQAEIERLKQANAAYQQLVLEAFQQVEDALVNIESYRKQYETAERASEWAEKSYRLYSDRHLLGVINYLDVAETERKWLKDQIQENTILGLRYIATIQLIRALGGGW